VPACTSTDLILGRATASTSAKTGFGKDGPRFVILLGGGTKKRQQRDIDQAISRWQEYKNRKT
jgi:putative component of toxin-antitoxin plasmid stabilization module